MVDCTEREFLQSFTNMLPSEDARNDFVNQGVALCMLNHLQNILNKLTSQGLALPSGGVQAKGMCLIAAGMTVLSLADLRRLRGER